MAILKSVATLGVAQMVDGIENLHVAKVTLNSPKELTGDTPLIIPGFNSYSSTPNKTEAKFEADNKTYANKKSIKDVTGQLILAGITPEMNTYIFDAKQEGAGQITSASADSEFIMKYNLTKLNGGKKWVAVGCAKFVPTTQAGKTRGDSLEGVTVDVTIAPPNNNSLGSVGEIVFDSDSDEWKELGYTIEEFEALFYADFGWDIKPKGV